MRESAEILDLESAAALVAGERDPIANAANLAAAIAGLAYDPYTKVQKNGKTKKYNDWETLLKSAGALETYMARRPVGWECPEEFIAMSEESEAK